MKQEYQIKEGDAGHRIDVVLTGIFGNTRSYWQKQLKAGTVTVDGMRVKSGYKAEVGQHVVIAVPEVNLVAPELPAVYEDDDLIIVDKPAGMLVHPTPTSKESTVSHFALLHSTDRDRERPGIVHRLDRETSGLLVVAKNPQAKEYLQKLFKSRLVHKTYQALVIGHLQPAEATINLPIGRSLRNPSKRAVNPLGRHAVTRYRVVREWPGYSLVEVKPETGRTHQIRVHFAHIGHPIVGDSFYGGTSLPGLNRQFLHASQLSFTAPNGLVIDVTSELPAELAKPLSDLDSRYNR